MRGGTLLPALLYTAVGLALAFAPRRAWKPSLAALTITTCVLVIVPLPSGWLQNIFLGGWISVAASAASVHLPRGLNSRGAFALSVNAGLWSGGVIALAGSRLDLLRALPCAFVLLPAALTVDQRKPIIVKVVSSWLIAVAVLAAILRFLPVTPGYMPDHIE
jgi:hypothetical protein